MKPDLSHVSHDELSELLYRFFEEVLDGVSNRTLRYRDYSPLLLAFMLLSDTHWIGVYDPESHTDPDAPVLTEWIEADTWAYWCKEDPPKDVVITDHINKPADWVNPLTKQRDTE